MVPRRCLTSLTCTLTPSFQHCSAFLCLGIPQKLCQHRVNYETGPRRGRQTPATGRQTERGGEGEAAHHHRDYRPRVTIIIVSIVFVARSTALVLIAFDVLLDFCPDSSFFFGFFLVFYLFLFSFSLFSALFVLLVVYAAPSGGGVCVGQRGWVVRHLLCGRGPKTCCNLVNLASANEIFI